MPGVVSSESNINAKDDLTQLILCQWVNTDCCWWLLQTLSSSLWHSSSLEQAAWEHQRPGILKVPNSNTAFIKDWEHHHRPRILMMSTRSTLLCKNKSATLCVCAYACMCMHNMQLMCVCCVHSCMCVCVHACLYVHVCVHFDYFIVPIGNVCFF